MSHVAYECGFSMTITLAELIHNRRSLIWMMPLANLQRATAAADLLCDAARTILYLRRRRRRGP
jgi:hypothetical protein